MSRYSQTFDATYKVNFRLLENTPSSSTSTHAIFRVELGLYTLTTAAKVKYFSCLTSIFSSNFNLLVNEFSPGTLQPQPTSPYNYVYTFSTSFNTTGSYSYVTWMSGVIASKPSSGGRFYVSVYFYISPNRI